MPFSISSAAAISTQFHGQASKPCVVIQELSDKLLGSICVSMVFVVYMSLFIQLTSCLMLFVSGKHKKAATCFWIVGRFISKER